MTSSNIRVPTLPAIRVANLDLRVLRLLIIRVRNLLSISGDHISLSANYLVTPIILTFNEIKVLSRASKLILLLKVCLVGTNGLIKLFAGRSMRRSLD